MAPVGWGGAGRRPGLGADRSAVSICFEIQINGRDGSGRSAPRMRVQAERRDKTRTAMWSHAAALGQAADATSLVHGDLGGRNLIVRRQVGRWVSGGGSRLGVRGLRFSARRRRTLPSVRAKGTAGGRAAFPSRLSGGRRSVAAGVVPPRAARRSGCGLRDADARRVARRNRRRAGGVDARDRRGSVGAFSARRVKRLARCEVAMRDTVTLAPAGRGELRSGVRGRFYRSPATGYRRLSGRPCAAGARTKEVES